MYFTYTELIIFLIIWLVIDIISLYFRVKQIQKIQKESYSKGVQDLRDSLLEELGKRK